MSDQLLEAAALVAALDPVVAPRLLAIHPAAAWCRSCRMTAPCPTRGLAEAAARHLTDARTALPSSAITPRTSA